MFVLNNYDMRKAICDKWKNQTITQIASSLFKVQNGYLPESLYN